MTKSKNRNKSKKASNAGDAKQAPAPASAASKASNQQPQSSSGSRGRNEELDSRRGIDVFEPRSAFNAQLPIPPVRCPGMFADTAFFGQALRLEEDTVTIKNFLGRDQDFTLPTALAFVHSLALDLDDEMQAYADAWFHHYYLVEVPKLSLEQRKAEQILDRDFKELQGYKDPLFFCSTLVPTKDIAAVAELFKPPITYEKLVAYRRLMSSAKTAVPTFTLDDAKRSFEGIVKPKLTPLATIGPLLAVAVIKVERKQTREREEREKRDPPIYVKGIPAGLAAQYSMRFPALFPELQGRGQS